MHGMTTNIFQHRTNPNKETPKVRTSDGSAEEHPFPTSLHVIFTYKSSHKRTQSVSYYLTTTHRAKFTVHSAIYRAAHNTLVRLSATRRPASSHYCRVARRSADATTTPWSCRTVSSSSGPSSRQQCGWSRRQSPSATCPGCTDTEKECQL